MFTVYMYIFIYCIYIYILNKIHILHVEPVYIYIYIYTQPATLASKYILRIIYIYTIINVKCWLPEPWISNIFYLQHFEPFYKRPLAENTFPPLPSQLLQNFPLPRFKLSICTSSQETKISGIVIFSTFCISFCVLVLLLWLLVL